MSRTISARGHTSVVLVMDMNRFIEPQDRERFKRLRGSAAFTSIIRDHWAKQIVASPDFTPVDPDVEEDGQSEHMSIDEVGFVTGVFRQSMLENFATPLYQLNKDRISFPGLPVDNFQFKKLFMNAWDKWGIFVRPTATGMFVVRLTRQYKKPIDLVKIASDVIQLQVSFDVPGALRWQRQLEANTEPDDKKRESVRQFLKWLNCDEPTSRLSYTPVQWQVAMEVCRRLVDTLDSKIQADGMHPVNLQIPKTSTSPPLHDSYVIYQLDEIHATPNLLPRTKEVDQIGVAVSQVTTPQMTPPLTTGGQPGNIAVAQQTNGAGRRKTAKQKAAQVLVMPENIHNAPEIKRGLIQLIEGSILREPYKNNQGKQLLRKFPKHRLSYVEEVFKHDKATWVDEICLLTTRAAIIIPSRRSRDEELFISTLPATTSKVMYRWYWDAMARMMEFIIEIRVLAQSIEKSSANVLQEFVETSRQTREHIIDGTSHIDNQGFVTLSDQAANLSRLVSVCQGLSNARSWSRAEYAVDKARHLFDQLGVPLMITHAERNVNNINKLLDHVEELHLATLSKRSSQLTFWLSGIVAGFSLIVLLYTLPSFWADIDSLSPDSVNYIVGYSVLDWVTITGNLLAPLFIAISLILLIVALCNALVTWYRYGRSRR